MSTDVYLDNIPLCKGLLNVFCGYLVLWLVSFVVNYVVIYVVIYIVI